MGLVSELYPRLCIHCGGTDYYDDEQNIVELTQAHFVSDDKSTIICSVNDNPVDY